MSVSGSVVPALPVAAPSWIQLGVFVIDASSSMTWEFDEPDRSLEGVLPVRTKAQAVDCVLGEFVERMRSSRKAANFRFAFVSFHHQCSEVRAPQPVLEIPPTDSYEPTANGTGGTAIFTGLEAAEQIVARFIEENRDAEVPVSAVVAVLSDGEEGHDAARTLQAAERLRAIPNTLIAAGLFATKGQPPAGEELLQALASRPDLYQRVYEGEELRGFFEASMTQVPLGPQVAG
jgi:hypothetical protein